jgi:hypothetical protein
MFNMKSRVEDQRRILDDRWIDELHRPVFIGPSGVATTFGWFTGRLKSGLRFLFKNGGQAGVATVLFMLPSEDLACVVLTNRADARDLAHRVCEEIFASYLPGWHEPEEDVGPGSSTFVATGNFRGRWQGVLINGGANLRATLNIESSNSGTFALGENAAEKISEMQSEGPAFTGNSTGVINSADARRTGANTLNLKLIPREGKLVGRVLAASGDSNIKNVMLPYVLTVNRTA